VFEFISKEEREKIPAKLYLLPEKKLFPMRNQKEFDSAVHLIGRHTSDPDEKAKLRARARLIAKREGYTLPKDWEDDREKEGMSATSPDPAAGAIRVAAFDITGKGTVAGEMVVCKHALLSVAGDYPDRQITLSPQISWAGSLQSRNSPQVRGDWTAIELFVAGVRG
jgi:hypothetical protein